MQELLLRGWEALTSGSGLLTVLVLGWLAYLLLLGGWIVLQKREPVATLSWLLGLALLPYVGFLIYHVFGPQKIRRRSCAGRTGPTAPLSAPSPRRRATSPAAAGRSWS